jgi:hypothetical protein
VAQIKPARRRVPIIDYHDHVLADVHETTLTSLAAAHGNSLADLATTKVKVLLDRPELAAAVSAFATVAPTASLRDARTAMGTVQGANDVFVTAGGGRQEAVVGWLTNTDLAQFSAF